MSYLGQAPVFYNPVGAVEVVGSPINLNGTTNAKGPLNLGDNIVSRPLLQDVSYKYVDKGTYSTGTVTFNYEHGNAQEVTIAGSVTIAIENWPPAGNLGVFQMKLKNGGSGTTTLPSINWKLPSGGTTTNFTAYMTAIGRTGLQSSGEDTAEVTTVDGGLTLFGRVS